MHLTVALCLGLYAMFSLYTLHADVTTKSITTNLPPVVNRTDGDCFYSCPFNNRSSSEYIEWLGVGTSQPCVYTVEVARVFKGNYTVSCSASSPMYSSCYASMYTYSHIPNALGWFSHYNSTCIVEKLKTRMYWLTKHLICMKSGSETHLKLGRCF